MNNEEIQSLIEQLKAQGLEDDEIMQVFYDTFTEGKMDRKDLETLAEAMGYELTDDFKEESAPDPIAAPEEGGEISKEKLEEAKEIEPGQSPEEFKEEIEETKAEMKEEEPSKEEPAHEEPEEKEEEEEKSESKSEEDGDEEKEWEEAKKLFKL